MIGDSAWKEKDNGGKKFVNLIATEKTTQLLNMKILFLMLFLPTIIFSQEAPSGANAILVKNIVFQKVVSSLLDQNFEIDKIDKDFLTVKTKFKKVQDKSFSYTLQLSFYIRIKDSTAMVSGEYILGNQYVAEQGLYRSDIINKGKPKNYNEAYQAFLKMNEFAKSLGGDSIEYQIK